MSDFHNRKRVKTRKPHKCEGCFEKVPVGTEITNCSGVYEGEFYNHYMCDPCLEWFDKEANEEFIPGEIGQYRKEEERELLAGGHLSTE
jgi:hypothetical protein